MNGWGRGSDTPPLNAGRDLLARRHAVENDMGGAERLRRLRESGHHSIRDRIDMLLDPGTFEEIGTFAHSERAEDAPSTPGDGKVGGRGEVDGRPVMVAGDDITVKRGSSSVVGGRKLHRMFERAIDEGTPFIYFGETGGARIPDMLGAEGFSRITPPAYQSQRQRRVPLVTAIVGPSFGGSSFTSALSDLTIQVKDTCLAVTSPRVIEVATGHRVSMEDLGGPAVHASRTGQVDLVADSDHDAVELIRTFLSYLPSNYAELPPISPHVVEPDIDLAAAVPESRRQTYDMRRVIEGIVDAGSFFEIRPLHARSVVTGLGRMAGLPVGVVANQPQYQVGVMTPESCDKIVRLLCLCDSFGLPLLFLHDTPGFMVGTDVEHDRLLYRAMLLQQAMVATSVPKLSVIIRKSFGLGNHVMGGIGMGSDLLVAWPGAEISFMDPDVGANVVYGGQLEGLSPEDRRKKLNEMADGLLFDTSPYGAAGIMRIDDVIAPNETRSRLLRTLERCGGRLAFRRRELANWPTCW